MVRPRRPLAVVGRDPRASGEMLEAAVCAGLSGRGRGRAAGRRAADPGRRVPHRDPRGRPGRDDLGGSHNAMPDNGIKLFAAGGHKLPDAVEDEIEAHASPSRAAPTSGRPATTSAASPTCPTRSISTSTTCSWPPRARSRCCTWSWTAPTAPRRSPPPGAYERAGARVTALAAEPDGWNINEGVGSTHLEGPVQGGRRARGPTSASPTTETPTGASRSARTASVVDGDADPRRARDGHARETASSPRTPSSPP